MRKLRRFEFIPKNKTVPLVAACAKVFANRSLAKTCAYQFKKYECGLTFLPNAAI
jgi:hypothetical protein